MSGGKGGAFLSFSKENTSLEPEYMNLFFNLSANESYIGGTLPCSGAVDVEPGILVGRLTGTVAELSPCPVLMFTCT